MTETDQLLISACLIVRDEAPRLEALFAAAGPAVDEWIVVDTGSVDDTVERLHAVGARVLHHVWDDDFAAARNVGLPHARGEWTLVLDADDVLQDAEELRRFVAADPDADVLRLEVVSPIGGGAARVRQARLFRTALGVRYRFPIHELPDIDGLRVADAPGSVRHEGYRDPELRRGKAERVLRILPKLAPTDPARHVHAARAWGVLGRPDEVQRACAELDALGYVLPPDLRLLGGMSLVATGAPERAIALLADGVRHWPDHPDVYWGLLLAAAVGYLRAAGRDDVLDQGLVESVGHAPMVADLLVRLGIVERRSGPPQRGAIPVPPGYAAPVEGP